MNIKVALCAVAAFVVCACDRTQSEVDALQNEAVPVQTPVPNGSRTLLRTAPVAPYPEAASVRLFVRGDQEGTDEYVEADGRLLSPGQRAALEKTLSIVSYDRPPDSVAACFVPHHFVRYFDRKGQQIGEIEICLCCHGSRATPDVAGSAPEGAGDHHLDFDATAFRRAITEMGLPTDINC